MRTPLIAGVLALGVITGVTACSQASPAPTPSTRSTPTAHVATCTKGVALLKADRQHNEQPACDTFQVLGHRNHITIGDTKQLTVEGDHNTVVVKSVENITSAGDRNTIYYEGAEPDFDELGSHTKVLPISER